MYVATCLESDGRIFLDIVDVGNVNRESLNFSYSEGEDIDTVWNGKSI